VSATGVLELEPLFHLVVVINHFNIRGALLSPQETDAVLIVDTDAELALALFPFQCFQPITGRHSEVICLFGRIKMIQSPASYLP